MSLLWRLNELKASQITGASIVCSTVCSGASQRNIKAPRHWPLWGESTGDRWNPPVTGGFPPQRVSHAENVSIWWHCYGDGIGGRSPSLWKSMVRFSHLILTMAADGLATQGTKPSAAIALSYFACNIPPSAPGWLITWGSRILILWGDNIQQRACY